ncbi:MAG: hypothetical protein KatS3mg103_0563 [Phycisphaerales bacterium]|nr:MAG: hypothetical protein KatS3mg103_0563 [Phycisphaerales bacterium]
MTRPCTRCTCDLPARRVGRRCPGAPVRLVHPWPRAGSAAVLLSLACVLAAALPAGCYRKIVDARGIGAQSTKLRSSYEDRPQGPITTRTRSHDRETRPARERERP